MYRYEILGLYIDCSGLSGEHAYLGKNVTVGSRYSFLYSESDNV